MISLLLLALAAAPFSSSSPTTGNWVDGGVQWNGHTTISPTGNAVPVGQRWLIEDPASLNPGSYSSSAPYADWCAGDADGSNKVCWEIGMDTGGGGNLFYFNNLYIDGGNAQTQGQVDTNGQWTFTGVTSKNGFIAPQSTGLYNAGCFGGLDQVRSGASCDDAQVFNSPVADSALGGMAFVWTDRGLGFPPPRLGSLSISGNWSAGSADAGVYGWFLADGGTDPVATQQQLNTALTNNAGQFLTMGCQNTSPGTKDCGSIPSTPSSGKIGSVWIDVLVSGGGAGTYTAGIWNATDSAWVCQTATATCNSSSRTTKACSAATFAVGKDLRFRIVDASCTTTAPLVNLSAIITPNPSLTY